MPQELEHVPGPGREGEKPKPPLAPMPAVPLLCHAVSASPLWPCTHAHRALSHSPPPCSLGSKWFPPWAPPPPPPRHWSGGRGRAGPGHPIAPLAPKPPCFFRPGVCPPPPLCLSSRPPCSSLSPCPRCSLFTRLQLTFLGLSLPPPPSSHLLLTGMSLGQRRGPSVCLSLSASELLSLCLSLSCDLRELPWR